jgi:hypothetical protein
VARRSRPIWTLDCETDPFKSGRVPEPFLWGIYEGDTGAYHEFESAADVADFLADKPVLVYAHNGGKFDYHYLKDFIEPDEQIMVIGGRLARFKIGACELRDSLNLFSQTRLADFSKMEFDYANMEKSQRNKPEIRAKIREYLKSDCVNLYNLVKGFVDSYGLHFTQAGAAMKYWSRNYSKSAPRSTRADYETFSPFYYGGRVQCFANGIGAVPFKVVDINSAYPHAMLSAHPYSVESISSESLPADGDIGPCMIELDATAKGCFPLRGDDGSLYFPDDETAIRRYYITGWELLAAFETDSVKVHRIVTVHRFAETVDFTGYVNHFYEKRQLAKAAGDKAQDIFAKIFLNALYGKFAANPTKYEEYVLSSAPMFEAWRECGYIPSHQWGKRMMMQRPLPEEKHRFYNVATGASITGYVRAHLWRSLNQCSGLLYCDTDIIAARDVSGLHIGGALGQWKVEADCDEYAIAGKKLYAFHKAGEPRDEELSWKCASKGVKLSSKEIRKAARGETVRFTNEVPNYSVHKQDIGFIDRSVKSTYKDISKMQESNNV